MLFGATVHAALLAALVAAVASILFLRTRNFFYDSLSLAAIEVGLLVLATGIAAGVIVSHKDGELWWTWDARLTTALICWLLYASYLMLRSAMEEPTRRASSAAIVSILAFCDVPVIVVAVHWWLARNRQTARIEAGWEIIPVVMVGAILVWLRLRKEQQRRTADAARRSDQEMI